MITRVDINDRVQEWGLREDIIEKDYVLGWFLFGISQNELLRDTWIFKGGTCLKKCYFETYRFSEDLDFTVTNNGPVSEEILKPVFTDIATWIYETSGVEIIVNDATFKNYKNPRGKDSLQIKIPYIGPLETRRNVPKVKFDVTSDEVLVQDPVARTIQHSYPDRPSEGMAVSAYSYSEVFAEKLRTLAQRLRPRDLYDVVHIFRNENERPVPDAVKEILSKKCQFVGIPVPNYQSIEQSPFREELAAEWENMLKHQLPNLPPIESFWNELPSLFNWLESRLAIKPLKVIRPLKTDHKYVTMPSSVILWNRSIPLEEIRFAALNRLLIKITYQKKSGEIKEYVLEPYSLRETKEKRLILYAIKTGEHSQQMYYLDMMKKIEISSQAFRPQAAIEFSACGTMTVPRVPPPSRNAFESSRRKSTRSIRRPRKIRPSGYSDLIYTIECPYCGKRFKRKSSTNIKINPHKDKMGYPCSGRRGYPVW